MLKSSFEFEQPQEYFINVFLRRGFIRNEHDTMSIIPLWLSISNSVERHYFSPIYSICSHSKNSVSF